MLLTFVRYLIKMIFLLYCCKCKFLFFIAMLQIKNLIWFWENALRGLCDFCGKVFILKLGTRICISSRSCIVYTWVYRISRPEVFCRKSFLKKFAKLLWKHLWWSLLNKAAGQAGDLIKKRLRYRYFLVNFAKVLRSLFCRTSPWLYL